MKEDENLCRISIPFQLALVPLGLAKLEKWCKNPQELELSPWELG